MVLRNRSAAQALVPYGLAALFYVGSPTLIAHQDIGGLLASQPGVAERWRAHVSNSTFGTIHASLFSLPRPIGTDIPTAPILPVSADPNAIDLTVANPDDINVGISSGAGTSRPVAFPQVNRAGKSDIALAIPRPQSASVFFPDDMLTTAQIEPFLEWDIALSLELDPGKPMTFADHAQIEDPTDPILAADPMQRDSGSVFSVARIYFSIDGQALPPQVFEPFTEDDRPIFKLPSALAVEPDSVPSREETAKTPAKTPSLAKLEDKPGSAIKERMSGLRDAIIAEAKMAHSPAERMKLGERELAKAEKCLTEAIYYESRGEPERGQIGVAQVVLNRAFSPYYPDNICGVVYQNAHRWMSCQFTFACDGSMRHGINEPDAWERAKRISHDMMAGKLWLPEVGNATHYHAHWVKPWWVRTMRRIHTIGVHTFYRPKRWTPFDAAPLAQADETAARNGS